MIYKPLIKHPFSVGERVLFQMPIGTKLNPRYRGFEAVIHRIPEHGGIQKYGITLMINDKEICRTAVRGQLRKLVLTDSANTAE